MMKHRLSRLFALMICSAVLVLSLSGPAQADAWDSSQGFHVQVSSSAGEINYRTGPGLGYSSLCQIPGGTVLFITDISYNSVEGLFWGFTSYGGYASGWVSLRQTTILRGNGYHAPDFYVTVKTMYSSGVVNLRYGAGLAYSWSLQIPNGTQLHITDMIYNSSEGLFWGLTSYNGYSGYISIRQTALVKGSTPPQPQPSPAPAASYQAWVYDTGLEGLALKSAPDVNSYRYLMVPDNTALTITQTTGDGWGYTSYMGYSGWVFLKYTRITGDYSAEYPSYGFISPTRYIVYNTAGEGLELRCRPTVNSSTFGPIYDGTPLQVHAIQGSWAYVWYNGHYGWVYTTYIYRG